MKRTKEQQEKITAQYKELVSNARRNHRIMRDQAKQQKAGTVTGAKKKRSCSECGESLEKRRPQVLTCSGQCRTARQRRLAK